MTPALCAEPGCSNPRSPKAGYGLCVHHYNQHRKDGATETLMPIHLRTATAEEKFFRYTVASKSCWWWEGPTNENGYGVLTHDYQDTYAHRWIWDHLVGTIPEGMTIDHLCTNKRCVNPEHLEVVSRSVNNLRRHGNRVFCKRGHSMSDAYQRPDGGGRMCRTCVNIRSKARSSGNPYTVGNPNCPNVPRPKHGEAQ